MIVITQDNQIYTGETARDIVNKMMILSWNSPPTKDEYMAAVADRVKIDKAVAIIHDDPDAFLNDLRRLNYLTIQQGPTMNHDELMEKLDAMDLTENQRDIIENAFFVSSGLQAMELAENYARINHRQKHQTK